MGSSPQRRRRSDERAGAEGESERNSSDACGAADAGRARNGGPRGKALRDLTILRRAGIAAVRRRGVKRHCKRRERRAQEGAPLLWDRSAHPWFGKEQGQYSLTTVMDDATGAFLHGVFTLKEDAQSYLLCLRAILLERVSRWGCTWIGTGSFVVTMITGANARFAKPARKSQTAWRPLPEGVDVDRILSFPYQATATTMQSARGQSFWISRRVRVIEAMPKRVSRCVRHLLDGRWRACLKDQLLLETTPPVVQVPPSRRDRRERLNFNLIYYCQAIYFSN